MMSNAIWRQMRSSWFLLGILSLAASLPADTTSGEVQHVVLFWLNEPDDPEVRQLFLDAKEVLETIPGVLSVHAGEAVPDERPVVDDSFDIGYVMRFPDTTALRAYLEHPDHVALVRALVGPHVERVVIYDIGVVQDSSRAEQTTPWLETRLFFGARMPGGTMVSDQAWTDFLAEIVTPRFPEGFTVVEASGQYWSTKENRILAEPTQILWILHPDTSSSQQHLKEIIAHYKERFQQESVLRTVSPAQVAFE